MSPSPSVEKCWPSDETNYTCKNVPHIQLYRMSLKRSLI